MEETIYTAAMKSEHIKGGIDIASTSDALLNAMIDDPFIDEDTQQDIAKAAQVSLSETLENAIKKGQEEFKTKDFYVEIFIRQDPKLPANHYVPKVNIFPVCPTPTHEAAVWKIHGSGNIEYLWMVPSVKDGLEMLQKPFEVKDKELFGDLLDFMDGTLRKRAKKLNGEMYV